MDQYTLFFGSVREEVLPNSRLLVEKKLARRASASQGERLVSIAIEH